MKKIAFLLMSLFLCVATQAEVERGVVEEPSREITDNNLILLSKSLTQTDSLILETDSALITRKFKKRYAFKTKQLILPVALIGIGFIGLESDWLKYQNREIRDELQENIDRKLTFDDFAQYAPMVTVYGLYSCGVKGKHDFVDKTIILATAYILMGASVNGLKYTTQVTRPDDSRKNSFPSGHTATVFMGAEFLRQEYQDVSPWIGVAGYTVAAGTGFFRMYNNRHWLTDVLMGAGIGILSAKAAYWLYPSISKAFFHKRFLKNALILPYVSTQGKGASCVITF